MKNILNIIIILTMTGCAINQSLEKDVLPDTSSLQSVNYYAFGEAAFLENDMESAIVFFKRADAADSHNVYIKERLIETLAIASYLKEEYKTELLELGEKYYRQDLYTPKMLIILADAFRLQEMYVEADKYFLLSIKQQSSMNILIHYYKFRMNFFPPADIKLLDQALDLPWTQRDDILMLGELYGQIDAEKGLEILTKAYEKWGDEKSMAPLLTAYNKKGEKSKILELIRKRIDDNKSVADPIKAFLITRYFAQKEYEQILAIQQECFEVGTEEVLKSLFFSAINLNEYKTGIEAGQALEDLGVIPTDMMSSFNSYRAKLYFDSGQTDRTLEYLLKSDDMSSFLDLIMMYEFENNPDILGKLLNLLEKYRIATQKNDEVSYLLSLIYSQMEDKEKAIEAIDSVSLEYLQSNKLTFPAATIYLKNTANVEKARELIELDPDPEFTANEIISSLLYGMQHDSLAFKLCLLEFSENEKPLAATFLRYYILADKYDNQENMMKIIKRGLDMYPDNVDLMNTVGYMIADLQIESEYELAKQLLEEAVIKAPESEMIWDSLAWLYFRLGLYKQALEAMEVPLSKEIKNSEIAYHLAEIYLKLNKGKKAKEYLQLTIEIDDDENSVKLAEKLLQKKY